MTDPARFLTVWIGPSSYLDAAGVRHDSPRHLIGVSVPYVRGEAAERERRTPQTGANGRTRPQNVSAADE